MKKERRIHLKLIRWEVKRTHHYSEKVRPIEISKSFFFLPFFALIIRLLAILEADPLLRIHTEKNLNSKKRRHGYNFASIFLDFTVGNKCITERKCFQEKL